MGLKLNLSPGCTTNQATVQLNRFFSSFLIWDWVTGR